MVAMAAVYTLSPIDHSAVFCDLASALSLLQWLSLRAPGHCRLLAKRKDLTWGSFSPLTSQQHLVMITFLFLKFYLLLSLGHMHQESGSCFGFDHHHYHHILRTSTRQLCIQQVLNKDLLGEACPPPYLLLLHLLLFCRIFLTVDVPQSSGFAFLPFSMSTHPHTALSCRPHALSFSYAISKALSSHCLDGSSSIQSKRLSELVCPSQPVTSPFFQEVLIVNIHLFLDLVIESYQLRLQMLLPLPTSPHSCLRGTSLSARTGSLTPPAVLPASSLSPTSASFAWSLD